MKRISLVLGLGVALVYFTLSFAMNGQMFETHNKSAVQSNQYSTIDYLDRGYYVYHSLTDIAVDSTGIPHISYRGIGRDLRYATIQGGIWITEVIRPGTVARETAIALDSNDRPHICFSFRDGSDEDLYYANKITDTWTIVPVDAVYKASVGMECDIAIDDNDKVHISHRWWNSRDLKYTTNVSGDWVTEVVDTNNVAWDRTAIAVDSYDKVHIAYQESNQLAYVTQDENGGWKTPAHLSECSKLCGPAIAIDGNDQVHIAFSNDNAIQHAVKLLDVWQVEIAAANVHPSKYHSIAVDHRNNVHISFYNPDSANLGYAHNIVQGTWISQTIDNVGIVGRSNSIAVDSNMNVHVSYRSDFSSASILRAIGGVGAKHFTVGYSPEGSNGGIILREGGTNWDKMPTGIIPILNDVWGNAETNAFAVGQNSTILHFDGQSWNKVDINVGQILEGVWGSSANDVFVVGRSGTILHYDGNEWIQMASGTTNSLYAVWGNSASDVFAVGYGGLILHYDGSGWSVVDTGLDITSTIHAVWSDESSGELFAVGEAGIILHFDGTNWETMDSGSLSRLYSVWGFSENVVFVSGVGGKILQYDGTSWSEMESGTAILLYDVWGTAVNNLYAVGGNRNDLSGVILHFDGTEWSVLNEATLRYQTFAPFRVYIPLIVKD
ncbi:MAG: hypothetical protein GY943_00690 [Chloroflexi bacterium]|nr:hypothetical protein [Chloroflexota bacterium]